MTPVELVVATWRQVRARCPNHYRPTRAHPRAVVQVGSRKYCRPCAAKLLAVPA